MKRQMLAALLCACLLSVSFAHGEGLLPTLSNAYGIAMPSLTEALRRYPDSEENNGGATTEHWTNITEDDFVAFGVYLKRSGAALQTYQVEDNVFTATVTKGGGSFVLVFDTDAETADVTYAASSYDERLFAVKSIWNAAEEAEIAGRYIEAAEIYASLICHEGATMCYRDSNLRELRCYYAEGEAKRIAQDWDGAVAAFARAASYSDAKTQVNATRYAEGEAKRAVQDWDGAVAAFMAADSYSDAKTQVNATRYAEGKTKLAAQDWDGAVVAFGQAGSYSDAVKQIKETHYQHASLLLTNGDAAGALSIFNILKGYKDVDSLLANDQNLAAAAHDAKYSVGNYVTFGHYPQTREGNDSTPIEWLVLARDGNKVLLLSRYGLDAKPYNEVNFDSNAWYSCTLRTWLNSTFRNKAFTAQEQAGILPTSVDNSNIQGYSKWRTNDGYNTLDKIFLLSYAEANKYLGVTRDSNKNTNTRVAPTAYALKQGAFTSSSHKTVDGTASGWWWLRSPGENYYTAAYVNADGSLYGHYVLDDAGCVRPALWINLESGIF